MSPSTFTVIIPHAEANRNATTCTSGRYTTRAPGSGDMTTYFQNSTRSTEPHSGHFRPANTEDVLSTSTEYIATPSTGHEVEDR